MAVDKLVLRVRSIRKKFASLARKLGKPKGGYESVADFRKADDPMPITLSYNGLYGIYRHKIEFIGTSRLGLSAVTRIARRVCGSHALYDAKIYRFDANVDIFDLPAEYLAAACEIPGVRNSATYRENGRMTSSYPHKNRTKSVLIYDKIAQLRATRSENPELYGPDMVVTRFELRFSGRDVPIKYFRDIHRYADIDLMPRIHFRALRVPRTGLRPMEKLAAFGMRFIIREYGMQIAARLFQSGVWKYYREKFFKSEEESNVPDIRMLMQRGIRDWLDDRIRFPRLVTEELQLPR